MYLLKLIHTCFLIIACIYSRDTCDLCATYYCKYVLYLLSHYLHCANKTIRNAISYQFYTYCLIICCVSTKLFEKPYPFSLILTNSLLAVCQLNYLKCHIPYQSYTYCLISFCFLTKLFEMPYPISPKLTVSSSSVAGLWCCRIVLLQCKLACWPSGQEFDFILKQILKTDMGFQVNPA